MIDKRHNPNFIADVAGNILSEKFGEGIRLQADNKFVTNGSVVIRCRITNAHNCIPDSVIAKKIREDKFSYNPDSESAPNSAHQLFNDWAAAEFLGDIAGEVRFCPQLYGGSREFGLIVLEDLGGGEAPNTYDALLGNDAELAGQTLIEHVSLIGGLHAATIGLHKKFERIRQRLGAVPKPEKLYQDPWSDARNRRIPASEVREATELYRAVFEKLGISPEKGVADEIELVTGKVEENPKQFLAFCKGDQNAAGDYIRKNGVPRLFDFGVGGFRHALIEGMPGRFTWGCMMQIPGLFKPLMDAAYKSQLTAKYPEITDATFRRAMMEAGARWHIFHVIHRVPDAVSGDRQRGLTTLRQQTIAWLAAFAELYEELGGMKALGKSARRMLERLSNTWAVDASDLPYYPAFRRN